ncbi:MAG: TetR/AcrR family transcriptional regulator [Bacillota bacterium]|nr:TetR/AcrR family transcriptional regulator [Bacillota bacterium]
MGVNERREKEKQIRRNDIIDAAEKVIFSKGYDSATMDDIAKEAEFSKRTVYIYFNSKEQLYFEIMVRGYKILIQMIEASLNDVKGKNSLERIKQIGKTLYNFNNEYPDYFKAIMSYENGEKDFANGVPDESREECYALGEIIFGCLTSELTDGIREGLIRSELDVTNTAILLWSCVIGLFNTATKKRNYIEHYHKRNSEELLLEGLDFLAESIKNKIEVEENEK